MRISVIVPVLNERQGLPETIARVRQAIPDAEIIAAEAGSTDGTAEWLSQQPGVKVVGTTRGKGPQQNTGAAASTGDVLLFLHADCHLPPDAADQMRRALSDVSVAGGAFKVSFAEKQPVSLRVLAWFMNVRLSLFNRCFGDQALFARSDAFCQAHGFPDWPLFEDYEFVSRIKRLGRFAIVPSRVTISGRRFVSRGVWRTTAKIAILKAGFHAGVSPTRLKLWFEDVRQHLRQP